jgi:hypothetical protein
MNSELERMWKEKIVARVTMGTTSALHETGEKEKFRPHGRTYTRTQDLPSIIKKYINHSTTTLGDVLLLRSHNGIELTSLSLEVYNGGGEGY